MLYGFRKGLEPIAQTAELLFFLFILGLISMIVLGIQNIDFANLKPVLQEGLLPVIQRSAGRDFTNGVLLPLLLLLVALIRIKAKSEPQSS
ncbi:GerAB/ArcD/ProY family transporter [Paenibacillus albidus]|uniref:GerAB/ArcD/ProY family transporter n=1 Tax=Paenibacillus albidus TaxID=2041023 RepID=UPI001BE82792|nr:GerAB/ArcD/ProY family transporter [Paenibacillus albidus]